MNASTVSNDDFDADLVKSADAADEYEPITVLNTWGVRPDLFGAP
ncbi:hypothetical protein [Streptomyces sp. NPDC049040]